MTPEITQQIVTEEQVHNAVDYLNHHAVGYGEAKATRIKAEYMLKHIKAVAMKQFDGSVSGQEREALASKSYVDAVEEIFNATVKEEHIKAKKETAGMIVELWRTQSANLRGTRL